MNTPSFRDPWRGQHRACLIFLVLAALGAYAGTFEVYFIKDDLSMRGALSDEHARFDFGLFRDQLLWPTERGWDDIWRPIPALSWALDFHIFGPDPVAFHLVNFLFHALNAVLVHWLLVRLCGFQTLLAPFAGALAFALWPLHPEAVVWTTQRTVVMGMGFCLLGLIAYHVWLHRRRTYQLALALVAFTCGLLSREHAVALPAAFVILALGFGPARSLRHMAKDVVLTGLISTVIIATWFGARFAIFGRFSGGYSGFETMAAYGEAMRVFPRLPETLSYAFAPANRDVFGGFDAVGPWLIKGFIALQAMAVLVAAARLLPGIGRPFLAFRLLIFAAIFSVTAWIPVARVYYFEANLINSRSSYHLTGLLVAVLVLLVALPRQGQEGLRERRFRLGFTAVLLVSYALVLQANLSAFVGGGREVRGLQEALAEAARQEPPRTAFVVVQSPSVHRGVPTVDAYLPQLCAPPYTFQRLPVLPLVLGQEFAWPSALLHPETTGVQTGLVALRGLDAEAPVSYWRALPKAPWLAPLFGASESAFGALPPELIAPRDGEAFVVRPDGSVVAPRGPDLPGLRVAAITPGAALSGASNTTIDASMRWEVREAAAVTFAAKLPSGTERVILELLVPDRRIEVRPILTEEAKVAAGMFLHRLGLDPVLPGTEAFPWPLPAGTFLRGLPVQWRLLAEDAAGRLLGASPSRRFVLFEAQ